MSGSCQCFDRPFVDVIRDEREKTINVSRQQQKAKNVHERKYDKNRKRNKKAAKINELLK